MQKQKNKNLLGKTDEIFVVGIHVGELNVYVDEKIVFAFLLSFSYV